MEKEKTYARDPILKEPQSNKVCRVCLQNENEVEGNISPCSCAGSLKYIHCQCLKKWIQSKIKTLPAEKVSAIIENQAIDCELCKDKISIEMKIKKKLISCHEFKEKLINEGVFKIFITIMVLVLLEVLIGTCGFIVAQNSGEQALQIIMYTLIALFSLIMLVFMGYLFREVIIEEEYQIFSIRESPKSKQSKYKNDTVQKLVPQN